MKIFLTGSSGFIGNTLTRELLREGHEVTLLVRSVKKMGTLQERVSYIVGNPTQTGRWQEKIAEHDAVINLAGASIFRRWNNRAKKEIYDSRILSTRNVVDALSYRQGRETHLFSASGVSYYGYHEDEILDERSPPGDDFLADLASVWESETNNAKIFGVRVVFCRFGIVLGKEGGALSKLVPIFRFHLGSSWGRGEQWFSWIHEKDLVNIFLFLFKNKTIEGPVNFTAPHPVRNKEMAKTLGEVLRKTSLVPFFPGPVFRLIMGEFADVFLRGQRVHPQKLLQKGFSFRFPYLKEALEDLTEPD